MSRAFGPEGRAAFHTGAEILAKVDRATMADGLESRAPLLNSESADFALAVRLHFRTSGITTMFLCANLAVLPLIASPPMTSIA